MRSDLCLEYAQCDVIEVASKEKRWVGEVLPVNRCKARVNLDAVLLGTQISSVKEGPGLSECSGECERPRDQDGDELGPNAWDESP